MRGHRNGSIDSGGASCQDKKPAERGSMETFVALKAEIELALGQVPFYFRTGKRLHRASRSSSSSQHPALDLRSRRGAPRPNRLIIRIQPDGVKLFMMIRTRARAACVCAVPLNLSLPDLHERRDARRCCSMSFAAADAVHTPRRARAAWPESIRSATPGIRRPTAPPLRRHWGPSAAVALIERDGRTWHEDDSRPARTLRTSLPPRWPRR